MRKFIVLIFFIVGVTHLSYTQEMPAEVKKILDNYTKDSTAEWGPLEAKHGKYLSDSVQIKDLRVRALETYWLKHIFLKEFSDTTPLSEIIEPTGFWFILVMARNKPLYELMLDNFQGELKIVGIASLNNDNKWRPLLEFYPESTAINPIFFSRFGPLLNSKECFFYFKQKGPRAIYYIKPAFGGEPLDTIFTGSMKTLDDSKKLMEYWKALGINEVGRRGGSVKILKTERDKQ